MSPSETDTSDTQIRREISEAAVSYREYASAVTTVPDASPAEVTDAALTVLADSAQPDDRRIEALRRTAPSLIGSDRGIEVLLTVVGDRTDAPAVREAAIDALGGAAFLVSTFAPHRPAYRDVLRGLITDEVPALREVAVSTLAHEHDPVVQEALAAGLRDERPLPVDRSTAIRALAEDDHLDNVPWLRELYRSESPDERQEAVRYLGSYPQAQDTVEAALRDRDETAAVRQQGAASLRMLDPQRFQDTAKEIAADSSDYPEVRVVALNALQHLGDTGRVYGDGDFLEQVRSIGADDTAPQVARAARRLIDRGSES